MKKKNFGFFASVLFSALCFVLALSLPFGFGAKTPAQSAEAAAQTTLSTGEKYLAWYDKNHDEVSFSEETLHENLFAPNGPTQPVILAETVTQNQLVSYLEIQISDWTNISNLVIKRIVAGRVSTLTADDANTPIASSTDASTFLFSQSGAYVVLFDYNQNGTETTHALFCTSDFDCTILPDSLGLQNAALEGGILLAQNGLDLNGNVADVSVGFADGSVNTALFSAALHVNQTEINYTLANAVTKVLNNQVLEIVITNPSGAVVQSAQLPVFVSMPKLVFFDTQNQPVKHALSGTSIHSDILFFNTPVVPELDMEGYEQAQLFDQYFLAEYGAAEASAEQMLFRISLKSDKDVIVQQYYQEVYNPQNYFELALGSASAATTYPIDNLVEGGVYVINNVFARGINGYTATFEELSDSRAAVCVLLNDTPVAAYAFDYVKFPVDESHCITMNRIGYGFTISNSINKVPVDLFVLNNDTGELYELLDLFQNNQASVRIQISAPGDYTVVAKYRGQELNFSQNTGVHCSCQITVGGDTVLIRTNTSAVLENQIVNGAVTVNATSFKVYRNGTMVGNYTRETTFSETGYYTVEYGANKTRHFTIINSEVGLTSYSVSGFGNLKPTAIVLGQEQIAMSGSYTILLRRGFYTISNQLESELPIVLDGAQSNLTTHSEFSYHVNIEPISFFLTCNVKNGERTSKTVKLDSITAEGNWTVSINRDGKVATYTKDQFAALTEKQRSFSGNGLYTVTITDGNGNTFEFMFEKYFKMNVGLIILIVIGALLAVAAVVFFIRLRMRARVR